MTSKLEFAQAQCAALSRKLLKPSLRDGSETEMLAKSYPQLREIVGELRQINLVDEVRAFFDERIKDRRDRRAIEGYIREQAFADGMTAGEAKGLANGMTLGETEREQLRQENERLKQEVERVKANRLSASR